MTARTQDASTTHPTARKRPSRASRPAAAAATQPQPEPAQPKLAVVPNPSETPKAKPQATPALKAQPKPTAQVDLGGKPVTYWFPSAKLSDGTTVTCPHARYGHESEASAKRCISALVASKGHKAG